MAAIRLTTAADAREALAGIWANVLNTGPEPVQDDDDFFDCGGDSMAMVALLVVIKTRFDVDLAVEELFAEDFTFGAATRALADAAAPSGAR